MHIMYTEIITITQLATCSFIFIDLLQIHLYGRRLQLHLAQPQDLVGSFSFSLHQ